MNPQEVGTAATISLNSQSTALSPHSRFQFQRRDVLDPFLGGGTTLLAASRLGRHGIGYEIIPEIARQAIERLSNEEMAPEG